ncbi:MAG: M4 family metallopeptidase [Ferruginibacter sp.]|nr:M4 family metallopeptidase [Ferruginibacter sp.]
MKKFHSLLSALFLLVTPCVFAQPSLLKMKSRVDMKDNVEAQGAQFNLINATQAAILFSPGAALMENQVAGWLTGQLGLRPATDVLKPEGKTSNTGDLVISKLHQYYKGIKVEHGVISSTARNGKLAMMQMEFYAIDDNFNANAVLSEQTALQKAMDFTGAKEFMWDGYTGNDPNWMLPKGELVILQTYLREGELCLAYKFDIRTRLPLGRSYIYVDAQDGRIVLNDAVIKHAGVSSHAATNYNGTQQLIKNETGIAGKPFLLTQSVNEQKGASNFSGVSGTAATHYNGSQQIIADNSGTVPGKPYWLHQNRNAQEITTQNYNRQYQGLASNIITNFSDNDNNWTAAEYANANDDDAALDVHFAMQIISDYWITVHGRRGWDDNFGPLQSYIHVNEYVEQGNLAYNVAMDNAYWDGTAMYYGDGRNGKPLPPGDNSRKFNVLSSLDVSAHELGHAICQTTAALVYRWESGALNEGFSDIWAACIENYGIINNSSIATNKSIWKIGEEITINYQFGLRDMSDPISHQDPSTFKSTNWTPADFQTCRVPVGTGTPNNDDCGVHTNSNVLNKWFFLITQGESSINTKNTPYTVAGLGFNTTQRIAYLTELNLPPNSSFATCKTVSVNAATTLFGAASAEVNSVKNAWIAVGVDSNTYDMSNTPVFTTNDFISIGVGAKGNVWAGTKFQGLYQYNDTAWRKRVEIDNVRIESIKADKSGGIWIAQSGTQGGLAHIAGGVNYFTNPYTTVNNFYTVSTQTQVPSRYATCIYVDTFRRNDVSNNPKVWVATQNYLNGGNNTSGMLGQGLYSNYKQFQPVSDSLDIGSGVARITTVGGDSLQVWGFAPANYGGNKILAYNAVTNAFIRSYDHNTDAIIPSGSGFVARSIFFDAKKRAWIGLANSAVLVYDEHKVWHYINFASLFPAGSGVNPNAITGDPYGDVYIGTTAGLVFFDHGIGETNRLDSAKYYHLYTKTNGLPSSNINAIAYDTLRFKLLIATDNGIVFWAPPCLGSSCDIIRTNLATQLANVRAGNWSDPTIWSNNKMPDSLSNVTLAHPVVVDINAKCRSLVVKDGGQIRVSTGFNLTVYQNGTGIIYGVQRKQ